MLVLLLLLFLCGCTGAGTGWPPGWPDTRPQSENEREEDEGRSGDEADARGDEREGAEGAEPPAPGDPEVRSFNALLNDHRESIGCPPLTFHDGAATVALAHSRDMAERSYFDHTSPEGERFSDRLRAAGIAYSLAGENISRGHETGRSALGGWLGSPPHRENLETCDFTHHGVGRYERHWTHLLFAPLEG